MQQGNDLKYRERKYFCNDPVQKLIQMLWWELKRAVHNRAPTNLHDTTL